MSTTLQRTPWLVTCSPASRGRQVQLCSYRCVSRGERWPRAGHLLSSSSDSSCHSRFTAGVQASAVTVEESAQTSFEDFILMVQKEIIESAEALEARFGEGATFQHDRWEREAGNPNGGYGITSVLEGGAVLEKGACNISVVRGTLSAARAAAMSSRGRSGINKEGGQSYSAAAMSLVFHARSPFVPTLRADVRVFDVEGTRWFGGGCDLTPSYIHEEDCREFHQFWRTLCDGHCEGLYAEYKEWCDRYFYISARKEHRGVGGIFFDDLESADTRLDAQKFVEDVAQGIMPSWTGIVERRQREPYGEEQRQWQLLRRGRYLEFNLLYDRGVKFGLDGGRVESIMVSAPPLIAWKYRAEPEEGTPEHACLEVLKSPREWV